MTADIDAVLSRLRERPECRDAVEVIEELRRRKATDDGAYEHVVGLYHAADEALRVAERDLAALTAERDRLREAANTLAAVRADAMWMARLARSSSWPGEMAHRVEVAAERVLSLLGESPVPDEPTSDESFEHVRHGEGMSMFIGHVSGCPACEATRRKMLGEQTERFMERVKADAQPGPKHAAAPFGPTGEEQDR